MENSIGKRHREGVPVTKSKQAIIVLAWLVFLLIILPLLATLIATMSVAIGRGVSIFDVLPVTFVHLGDIFGLLVGFPLAAISGFLLALTLEIAAHEGGHVLAGRMVRFRLVLVVIGPLQIKATGRGLKVGLRHKSNPRTGTALSVPVTWEDLPRRMAIMVIGGPLGSLTLGLVALLLALTTSSSLTWLFQMSAILSISIVVLNLLPFKGGTGARIRLLLAGGPEAERFCYIFALVGATYTGQRPSQWNQEWITSILAPADGSVDDAAACHIAFYWALDRGDIVAAQGILQRLLDSIEAIPANIRPDIYADAAFFHGYYGKDPSTARAFLEKAGHVTGQHRHMQLRAEAATLLAEDRAEESRAVAREGLKEMLREAPRGPGWELDLEWLQALAG